MEFQAHPVPALANAPNGSRFRFRFEMGTQSRKYLRCLRPIIFNRLPGSNRIVILCNSGDCHGVARLL